MLKRNFKYSYVYRDEFYLENKNDLKINMIIFFDINFTLVNII